MGTMSSQVFLKRLVVNSFAKKLVSRSLMAALAAAHHICLRIGEASYDSSQRSGVFNIWLEIHVFQEMVEDLQNVLAQSLKDADVGQ